MSASPPFLLQSQHSCEEAAFSHHLGLPGGGSASNRSVDDGPSGCPGGAGAPPVGPVSSLPSSSTMSPWPRCLLALFFISWGPRCFTLWDAQHLSQRASQAPCSFALGEGREALRRKVTSLPPLWGRSAVRTYACKDVSDSAIHSFIHSFVYSVSGPVLSIEMPSWTRQANVLFSRSRSRVGKTELRQIVRE